MIGMIFILSYLAIGIIRVIIQLPAKDRKKFFLSLINPRLWIINLRDIICDVLLHTKIWKRKPLLGLYALQHRLRVVHAHRPRTHRDVDVCTGQAVHILLPRCSSASSSWRPTIR